jgi:drug/metabolite transporter (DMT)-like permease
LLPGLSAPPLDGAALMVAAGIAWGIYSLRGRQFRNPTAATAGNFMRSVPMTIAFSLVLLLLRQAVSLDPAGIMLAIGSGALTSGIGYAIWYAALPRLAATTAATVQLSVPVLAALGGILLLGETLTERLVFCSIAILGGIALVITAKRRA